MRTEREIARFMTEKGFTLVRWKKHNVWKKGELTVTTSQSPSDHHALQNAKRLVEKLEREARP